MIKETEIQITIGSPVDYQQLVAYISIKGSYIAMLSQENGPNKLELEFFNECEVKSVDFKLFTKALHLAKEYLLLR